MTGAKHKIIGGWKNYSRCQTSLKGQQAYLKLPMVTKCFRTSNPTWSHASFSTKKLANWSLCLGIWYSMSKSSSSLGEHTKAKSDLQNRDRFKIRRIHIRETSPHYTKSKNIRSRNILEKSFNSEVSLCFWNNYAKGLIQVSSLLSAFQASRNMMRIKHTMSWSWEWLTVAKPVSKLASIYIYLYLFFLMETQKNISRWKYTYFVIRDLILIRLDYKSDYFWTSKRKREAMLHWMIVSKVNLA